MTDGSERESGKVRRRTGTVASVGRRERGGRERDGEVEGQRRAADSCSGDQCGPSPLVNDDGLERESALRRVRVAGFRSRGSGVRMNVQSVGGRGLREESREGRQEKRETGNGRERGSGGREAGGRERGMRRWGADASSPSLSPSLLLLFSHSAPALAATDQTAKTGGSHAGNR